MPGTTPDVPRGVLPLRSPHPLATHIAVDTAVTFLATVILGLIFGVPFLVIVAVAIVAGLCLAPFTRRIEIRQLAERVEPQQQPPSSEQPQPSEQMVQTEHVDQTEQVEQAGRDDEHPSAGDEA